MVILLMAISGYSIGDYSINGYQQLFLLVVILLIAIGGYSINGYQWILVVIPL